MLWVWMQFTSCWSVSWPSWSDAESLFLRSVCVLQTDLIRVNCVWKGLLFILLLHPAAVPQPQAEDSDRYRRRFNMRMLVPGRPVKETPVNPPPVPIERPAYREKFIPPELSMWDYFVAKVKNWMQPTLCGIDWWYLFMVFRRSLSLCLPF